MLPIPIKIRPFEIFTRATPGSSLVFNIFASNFRFSFNLEKSRELEIAVYWRDWRSLCAVKFLRLEEFVDDVRHGMALQLEPKGMLFAGMVNSPLLISTFWSLSNIREPIKFVNLRVGPVNDPLSGKHFSLPFLQATS